MDFLTVPVLQNQSKKMKKKAVDQIEQEVTPVAKAHYSVIRDEYSQNDFSFDVEHIGDEASTKLLKDFDSTLWQFNSKQWYENLDGSEVVF